MNKHKIRFGRIFYSINIKLCDAQTPNPKAKLFYLICRPTEWEQKKQRNFRWIFREIFLNQFVYSSRPIHLTGSISVNFCSYISYTFWGFLEPREYIYLNSYSENILCVKKKKKRFVCDLFQSVTIYTQFLRTRAIWLERCYDICLKSAQYLHRLIVHKFSSY